MATISAAIVSAVGAELSANDVRLACITDNKISEFKAGKRVTSNIGSINIINSSCTYDISVQNAQPMLRNHYKNEILQAFINLKTSARQNINEPAGAIAINATIHFPTSPQKGVYISAAPFIVIINYN